MKLSSLIVSVSLCVSSVQAAVKAQEGAEIITAKTNVLEIEVMDRADDEFWQVFLNRYDERLQGMMLRRLSIMGGMQRSMALNNPERATRRLQDRAISSFRQAGIYTMRDLTEVELRVLAEKSELLASRFGSAVAEFFVGSVGSTAEEEIDPLLINLESTEAEESFFDYLKSQHRFKFGARPFRGNPYLFASFLITYDGQALAKTLVRYRRPQIIP